MVLVYAITLFISATLLFSVQPMVGKMILPALGGTPAAWNTCMVFFQAALLAGYAYAHASVNRLGVRRQAVFHLGLLLLGVCTLPIAVAAGMSPPTQDNPVFWLLGWLTVSVGLPVFVVASTAPLLQKWFAETGHPDAEDPYFLYAASNAGSLLALVSYPLLVERSLALAGQSRVWLGGYVLLIVLVAGCAVVLWTRQRRSRCTNPPQGRFDRQAADDNAALTGRRRAWWVLLSAVPSSLMLGVTAHMTTNVASMPLLWVFPLALYLLTFVLVFARRQLISPDLMSRLLPFVALVLAPTFFVSIPQLEWRLMLAHLAMFFIAAMICHGRLAQSRPSTRHLTEYYLWISIGGVLGGLFNTLVAPVVFRTVVEYPLMMCVVCLLRPAREGLRPGARARWLDAAGPAVLAVLAVGLVLGINATTFKGTWAGLAAVLAPVVGVGFLFRRRPIRFGLGYAAGLAALALFTRLGEGNLLHVERNFFGVKRVVAGKQGRARVLYHGTTVHGMQWVDPRSAQTPLAYYHPSGPICEVFRVLAGRDTRPRVGAIGLGTGAVAAFAQPGQHFVFYEIDPGVARIAANPRYFTFLAASRGTCRVVLGDGRLAMARARAGSYGLIFLDAYSSDAIPTHLLSREAMAVYLSKLADGGVLAFHITNRFMDLEPVVANLARDAHLVCRVRAERWADLSNAERAQGCVPSHVVIMARRFEDLGPLAEADHWRTLPGQPDGMVWTDQYCDILGPLLAGSTLWAEPGQ